MTSERTPDAERLQGYVEAWRVCVDDVVALLRDLDEDEWAMPTDLPGWDVRAVAAHLAHLESELAGIEQVEVRVPELDHIRSPMGAYTEQGPLARAEWTTRQIVDELVEAARLRLAALRDHPPTDPEAHPDVTPGGIRWSWENLLSNRVVDLWMHEQDVRRAVGRPGGMTTPGAAHTTQVFLRGFAYAIGKRVAPPAGTTVRLDVTGASPVHLVVEVGEDGRARPTTQEPAAPTTTLRMDLETFAILAGGRRDPDMVDVEVGGDTGLGRRVLAEMAVTP